MVTFSVWFFTLTISAMMPGIFYEGGKGYSKIFGSHLFSTKEKGFVFFLLELVVGFFLVLLFGLFQTVHNFVGDCDMSFIANRG
ncbi:hypothetical protein DRN76_04090 [Methanosarcinales archaeon]|nr:MAG: hypothetical protein DRN76_04090 [Methanosarcinales archaeon]